MPTDPLTLHLRALVADTVADAVEPAIEAALTRCLPEILRRAQRPALLDKKGVVELTGWSPRKVEYLKSKRAIPYIRRGRSVWYRTEDIEAYLDEGYVPARERT